MFVGMTCTSIQQKLRRNPVDVRLVCAKARTAGGAPILISKSAVRSAAQPISEQSELDEYDTCIISLSLLFD